MLVGLTNYGHALTTLDYHAREARACNTTANFMAKWVRGADDGLHLVGKPPSSYWRLLHSDLGMVARVDIVE
ncbi:hypothetical protein PVK06_030940 [Gossypium arboreum]|uniref:Uncharacterized protein n=1 Tax=Gossypium arboreum TaxID=29729 RepID=A0ABR0NPX6_GOSAR|nr:hypothetical protein PVK06_030940 [Gossypium arboreum]